MSPPAPARGPARKGAPPDGTAPHVLVADVDRPVLDQAASHHLRRVLRLRPGAALSVTDGRGVWRTARLTGSDELGDPGPRHDEPRARPEITVAFALTKGAKPEWTVQKLVEVGVDVIVPFRAARSVVRWDVDKAAAHVERWRAVGRAALEQSHRCWLPEITEVSTTAAVAERGAVAMDRGGVPLGLAHNVVAVGPEGGWSDTERAEFTERVACSPNVLRAETAAITTGAVLCALRSGMAVI